MTLSLHSLIASSKESSDISFGLYEWQNDLSKNVQRFSILIGDMTCLDATILSMIVVSSLSHSTLMTIVLLTANASRIRYPMVECWILSLKNLSSSSVKSTS